ncbi:tripartite tricarboxylate transporter TctB family protein [Alisedimentitalea sp. MJ-SS2]|uniref:tripartite tricarboxylate transporter TctB family protein n=1 Tax=Aliisedimentitalea sp. MJ-SS2 TaxID=3049795 RepID=UPI0029153224|nr:tripartite tricarboxylate transporter TctB family protein [Alisedimentitalea sp. MJ-SS2]MDU8928101.1 tripartite tricarboxylate transporter TctB family protein [Alisedimentitalea sp. MJ-SS2]
MQTADRMIALAIVAMSAYFMYYAWELPIGWNGETGGPGAGAFPFWLSLIMAFAALGVLLRSLRQERQLTRFFSDRALRPIIAVTLALTVTIFLMPLAGAYIALPLFMLWYLKIFGRHGWILTGILAVATPVFLFFFFEVTLKILLPKGFTEPWFIPLYAKFF